VENSRQFNGEYDQITRDAQTIFAACFQKFAAVSLNKKFEIYFFSSGFLE
jgi:hypothetical protein